MSATKVEYSDIELWTIILNAVNVCVSTVFYASVQNKFPTEILKLAQQLNWVCDQNKKHRQLLNDLASRMGLKKDASGICVSVNTATDVIPRKTKGEHGDKIPAAAGSATHNRDADGTTWRGYALCKQYSPSTSTS